jgi:hypothetical protein
MSEPARFRFRPRFRGIALLVMLVGGGAVVAGALGAVAAVGPTWVIGFGAAGLLLGLLYLRSPAWRITVVVDDEALEVQSAGDRRFRLPWSAVERVVASPKTNTVWVYGGSAERSLLVPGDGASAPYDIEDKPALYRAILARVPSAVVQEVDYLDQALPIGK